MSQLGSESEFESVSIQESTHIDVDHEEAPWPQSSTVVRRGARRLGDPLIQYKVRSEVNFQPVIRLADALV